MPRQIGQRITEHIPLPDFPEDLKKELINNELNPAKMNKFLREHVLSVVGANDAYLTIQEKDVLGDQVVRALTLLKFQFADTYKVMTHSLLAQYLKVNIFN